MRRHGWRCVWLFVFCCAVAVLGGRQGQVAPPFAEFVYVATNNGTIRQFGARPDGTLAALSPPLVRVAPPNFPLAFVLHPSRAFAYAATINDQSRKSTIYPYRVLTSGTLAPIGAGKIPIQGAVSQLLADPKGRLLFGIGEAGKVFTFRCLPNGRLESLPVNSVKGTFGLGEPTGNIDIGSVSIEPLGRYFYNSFATGFLDHSEHSLTTYRVLSSGALRPIRTVSYQPNGWTNNEHGVNERRVGSIGFDIANRWAYLNTEYSNLLVFLRVCPNGTFGLVREQVIQYGQNVERWKNEDGSLHTKKHPLFERLLLLDTQHQIAVLAGRENTLTFAHVASNGVLHTIHRIDMVGVIDGVPIVLNSDARFLYTETLPKQILPYGKKTEHPSLVTVRVGDKTQPPRKIQTLSLGGDFVQIIVTSQAKN